MCVSHHTPSVMIFLCACWLSLSTAPCSTHAAWKECWIHVQYLFFYSLVNLSCGCGGYCVLPAHGGPHPVELAKGLLVTLTSYPISIPEAFPSIFSNAIIPTSLQPLVCMCVCVLLYPLQLHLLTSIPPSKSP